MRIARMGKPSPPRVLAGMMTGLLMARIAPSTGISERDSSRALNFARGSFATFLAPSRKVENKFFFLIFILDRSENM